MTDIDILVRDLRDFIAKAINKNQKEKDTSNNKAILDLSLINIRVNFHAHELENLSDTAPRQKLYPQTDAVEPVIDVFDGKKILKIVALVPGIRKDDINFNVGEGFLELEIRKGGQVYRKQIPCDVKPSNVSIKSTSYNNSVLEMVFNKT